MSFKQRNPSPNNGFRVFHTGGGAQFRGRQRRSLRDSHAFAIYAALLAAFFCISFPLTRLAIYLERRLV